MQICKIQNGNNIYSGVVNSQKNVGYRPSFGISCDRFERTFEPSAYEKPFNFNREINLYYDKLEQSMGISKPKDIEVMVKNIQNRFEDESVSAEEIYDTLDILTQYSSYKSLQTLKESFLEKNIEQISNLNCLYKNSKNNKNIPICLTNALHYISTKNLNYKINHFNESIPLVQNALVIDSKILDIIEGMHSAKRDNFINNLGRSKTVPIYIKNFENGYNVLNQIQNLEDMTVNCLQRAKIVQQKKGYNTKESVEYVLNNQLMSRMNKLDLGYQTIDYREDFSSSFVPRSVRIADNINPIIISKKDLKKNIEELSKGDEVFSQQDIENYYMDFLNKMMLVITPKQYSDSLKEIHSKLLNFLKMRNKSIEDTYFVVPAMHKSFALINYQYQNINNIAPENIIYYQTAQDFVRHGGVVSSLPDNSTIVVLDDCIMSGNSMTHEQFDYDDFSEASILRKKGISVVFASIVAANGGINNITKTMLCSKRGNFDKIITDKPIAVWNDTSLKIKKIYGGVVPIRSDNLTSVVFPYMGPDTNSKTLKSIYEKFLFDKNAQKNSLCEM